ncbi:hypothetical protein RL72_01145 [Microbacterium azadirachtae]|uniref:Uncharacterized protein n=1 Tax=Microbacterium azadirachtae TaxID=582680 RepID=A0A0F0L1H8_9MICO|nr:hypothetical protein RL72_01145 [Microbacterium azadirachtae]
MTRSALSPHHVHEARRPEHISDSKVDASVNALTVLAHGGNLKSANRSRNLADADAAATIDRLLRGGNAPTAGEPPTSPVRGHAGDGRRLTAGPVLGAARGEPDPALRAREEYAMHVREGIRRTAMVPSVLTVPCAEHDAEAGTYCFRTGTRGVCWRRVVRRAVQR